MALLHAQRHRTSVDPPGALPTDAVPCNRGRESLGAVSLASSGGMTERLPRVSYFRVGLFESRSRRRRPDAGRVAEGHRAGGRPSLAEGRASPRGDRWCRVVPLGHLGLRHKTHGAPAGAVACLGGFELRPRDGEVVLVLRCALEHLLVIWRLAGPRHGRCPHGFRFRRCLVLRWGRWPRCGATKAMQDRRSAASGKPRR